MNNPLVFCGPRDKRTLNPAILECEDDLILCRKLANLTIDNCIGQNGLITRVELRLLFDIDISVSAYATLGRAVNHFVNRLTVVPHADDNRIGPCRVQQQRGSRDHQYQ